MKLKRMYDHDANGEPTKVSGIRVMQSGKEHHFSPRLIEGGIAEGWLSMGQGKITIDGEGGPIIYNIKRMPGYYCCHCERKLDDGAGGQAHVAAAHVGQKWPDPSNPAGYRRDNFYAGVKAE